MPWTEEPGGLLSMESHRVGHDWSDSACMHALEKGMATPSRVLAWRIPGIEEPGGLPSTGLHRVRHNWMDLAAAAEEVTNLFNFIELEIMSRPCNWYCLLLHCNCLSWKWFSVWLYVYHFLNRHCSELWIITLNRPSAFIFSWYLVRVLFYFG